MKKNELLKLLKTLNFPKDEYYVLGGASLVLRGIKEEAGDLDLCISNELFKKIKDKYDLTEDKKNDSGFYCVNDLVEVVVNSKEEFNMDVFPDYNLENIKQILDFKIKRGKEKDKEAIIEIKKYLERNNLELEN